jgi:UDP-GlcNAc:undecaprenyl-phosphate GlcNAc-1-phosphate transferase
MTLGFPFDLGPLRYPAALIIALLLSLYFTPLIRKGAIRYNVVDSPDENLKKHREPTPYLGGIAIFVSFLFTLAFTYEFDQKVLGLLLSASIVVMLGLFDDLRVLTPRVKLAGQIIAALILIKSHVQIDIKALPDWADQIVTVVWLVALSNAINLIDVSDGLAAGVSSIAGMFLYVIMLWGHDETFAMLTLALVGSTFGFLAYNRAPAKIFLGDAGSMFLGFMLGALAMNGRYTFNHIYGLFAPILILGVPIFDTVFVIGARLVRRIPIMRGSPDHFAVRLRNHGVRPGMIALSGYVASIVLGAIALAVCLSDESVALGLLIVPAVGFIAAVVYLVRLGRGPEDR